MLVHCSTHSTAPPPPSQTVWDVAPLEHPLHCPPPPHRQSGMLVHWSTHSTVPPPPHRQSGMLVHWSTHSTVPPSPQTVWDVGPLQHPLHCPPPPLHRQLRCWSIGAPTPLSSPPHRQSGMLVHCSTHSTALPPPQTVWDVGPLQHPPHCPPPSPQTVWDVSPFQLPLHCPPPPPTDSLGC